MSSVQYGTRLGDLKNKQSTHTHSLACATVQAFTRHFSRSALGAQLFKFETLTVENS